MKKNYPLLREITLVVKVINQSMRIKRLPPNKNKPAASVTTHYVSLASIQLMVGTSVGEGTFGKVKLGKHILTGEKVK